MVRALAAVYLLAVKGLAAVMDLAWLLGGLRSVAGVNGTRCWNLIDDFVYDLISPHASYPLVGLKK